MFRIWLTLDMNLPLGAIGEHARRAPKPSAVMW